jgi:hypothetical protein
MKTTVEISDPLFAAARALAEKEGLSFRTLVEEGLRNVVERRSTKPDKRFRLRDGRFRGKGGLQPNLDWSDLRTLAYSGKFGGDGA